MSPGALTPTESKRIGIAQRDRPDGPPPIAIAKHIESLNQLRDGTDIAKVLLSTDSAYSGDFGHRLNDDADCVIQRIFII